MADYKIEIKKSVAKEIKSLPNSVLTHLSHHKTTRKPSTKPQEPIAYKATLIALEKKHCELKLFCLSSMR